MSWMPNDFLDFNTAAPTFAADADAVRDDCFDFNTAARQDLHERADREAEAERVRLAVRSDAEAICSRSLT